ncbi:hypothetical protein SEA_CHASER_134 [Mycobacterium phage Chaser]|nr:hypothetical protein SEA_CHASER_134 [Mycobacterium phage Chaser]
MNALKNVKAGLKELRSEADAIIYSPSTTALNGFAAAARSRAFKEALDLIELEELSEELDHEHSVYMNTPNGTPCFIVGGLTKAEALIVKSNLEDASNCKVWTEAQ